MVKPALTILKKEIAVELRTRYALNTSRIYGRFTASYSVYTSGRPNESHA